MIMMEKGDKSYDKCCIVPRCINSTKNAPDKVFFHMPRNADIRRVWYKAMKRTYELSVTSTAYLCEDHFNIEEDTENFIKFKILRSQGHKTTLSLKKDVVPHKFLCQTNREPPPERTCVLKRKRLELVNEAISDYDRKQSALQKTAESSQNDDSQAAGPSAINVVDTENTRDYEADPNISLSNVSNTDTSQADKAIQVNIRVQYRSKGVNVKSTKTSIALSPCSGQSKDIATSPIKAVPAERGIRKKPEPSNLTDKASVDSVQSISVLSSDYEPGDSSDPSYILESGEDSDDETEYKNLLRRGTLAAIEREPKLHLGLPKSSYYLINALSENIPLPVIDILITLKKVKLNESFDILAIQFGYAQSTISRIFSKSTTVIAEKMKELIVWPTKLDIRKKLPISFRARYSDVVSIIDCFEIQIERPSNAVHQSLTWSQYKKCNTLKYLISCTPDGLVNYVSEGYGGRATDVMIVKDCGYLERLQEATDGGDATVMADRGFKDLSCLLERINCTLVRPPSVFKSTPSTKDEVKLSKRIAALRIHIERVINRLRDFHILLPHACVDHSLIPVIDEVVVVACGLINMQSVLIKK